LVDPVYPARSFSFSGYGWSLEKRRSSMPMQAFIDESESQGQQFVFAGFIGSADSWTVFADRWEASRKRLPEIQKFKFYDFAQRSGSFSSSRLPEAARKQRASELVATMSGLGLIRISIAIGLPGFFEMSRESWSGLELAIPYCYAFQLITAAVAQELLDRGHRGERFEIIFDEHLALGPKAKKWYPLVRELCVSDEIRTLMPMEPQFQTDDTALPLQAADLHAGLVRSGKGEESSETDAMLARLLVALSEVGVSHSMAMRVHAQKVRSCWDQVLGAGVSPGAAAMSFAPIVARMRKNLLSIGGDRHAEGTLAPLFEAGESISPAHEPDGYDWLRQELAETTLLSAHSKNLFAKTNQERLEEAMRRHGITRDQLGRASPGQYLPAAQAPDMPDEKLNRAIALLDEASLDAFRSKLAQKRAKRARKRRT
jgi:hypothetical protein